MRKINVFLDSQKHESIKMKIIILLIFVKMYKFIKNIIDFDVPY